MKITLERLKDPLFQSKFKRRTAELLENETEIELEKYMFSLSEIFGFDFLEIKPLHDLLLKWVDKKNKGDKKIALKLEHVAENLNIHYFKQSEINKRRTAIEYWKIYLEVEEEKEIIIKKERIKDSDSATSEACRRIAKRLGTKFNTIRARYNEKRREANEYGLSPTDVRDLLTKL
ncbi:hypothetical protein MYX76_02475 [Desulfobacterota bacterium AH_259_B03_O07]|nr:hypothetical protein [Desulfobacterota bacterium AH_259_B03_O07]